MATDHAFAATLIRAAAVGCAASAAERLLERHPALATRFGDSAFAEWRQHLELRLRQLAAALDAGEPALFASEVTWSRETFVAREVPVEDLEASLTCLAEVLGAELPESAAAVVAPFVEAGVGRARLERDAEPGLSTDRETGRLALRYLEAVLEGDRRRAIRRVLEAVDGGLEVRTVYAEVLLGALTEVGRLWQTDRLSIAQEHFVTETTRSLMTALVQRVPPAEPNGRAVLVAGVAGNAHDLAPRMVADFFEMEGWRTVCLGSDVPASEIAAAIEAFAIDLLALSVTLVTHLPEATAAIRAARRSSRPVKILVGGRAFAALPELWRRIEADGYAPGAREAPEVGARLVDL